ncbi:MAG: flavin reductase, partial [Acidimicrobiia bacterium]
KVLRSMDADENTIFLADVVAAERLRKGPKLDVGKAWGNLPAEWLAAYDKNHHLQIEDARVRRGLN